MMCWSKGDFSFLSMRVCVCLKIMTPKSKQNYVRCIIERAREFMESSRKKIIIKMRELEKERVRELLESSGSKEKKRKKKKKKRNVWIKEKAKNKKSQFKNNTTIFSQ